MRLAAKSDATQSSIVDALRRAGCSVTYLYQMGRGIPDLLVGFRGVNLLMEVKTEDGKLTPAQIKYIGGWNGKVHVVHSEEEALNVIASLTQ